MPNLKDLEQLHPFFMEKEQCKDLLEIAKKQGKSLVDVTSDALRTYIEKNRELKESRERKILCD